jgi:hypothetical protein
MLDGPEQRSGFTSTRRSNRKTVMTPISVPRRPRPSGQADRHQRWRRTSAGTVREWRRAAGDLHLRTTRRRSRPCPSTSSGNAGVTTPPGFAALRPVTTRRRNGSRCWNICRSAG